MGKAEKIDILLRLVTGKEPSRMKIYTVTNGVKRLVSNKATNAPICINIQVFTNDASLLAIQHLGANMEDLK